ncbi:hypothetical protein EV2_029955 [Malus domestica]
MESPAPKHTPLRNILVRLLTFGIIILALRSACIITLAGESYDYNNFCFFPDNSNSEAVKRCDSVYVQLQSLGSKTLATLSPVV